MAKLKMKPGGAFSRVPVTMDGEVALLEVSATLRRTQKVPGDRWAHRRAGWDVTIEHWTWSRHTIHDQDITTVGGAPVPCVESQEWVKECVYLNELAGPEGF